MARLKNTESQLKRKPDISQLYTKTLEHYIEKGFISKVSETVVKNTGYYMPHFPVVNKAL